MDSINWVIRRTFIKEKVLFIYKDKLCTECKKSFSPTSKTIMQCPICYPILRKKKNKLARDKHQAKIGKRVGVGSGGLQKERLGELSSSFKTGIGTYRKIMQRNNIPFICNHCKKDLAGATRYEWCTHHKDQDRTNNDISNLEYLCKRCHQIEHECWKALGIDDKNINKDK